MRRRRIPVPGFSPTVSWSITSCDAMIRDPNCFVSPSSREARFTLAEIVVHVCRDSSPRMPIATTSKCSPTPISIGNDDGSTH
jgi:hypothetical protein